MIAGTLEIQLLANMARLQKDMDDAKRSVGGAMAAIEKSVDAAKAAFVGLAGAFVAGVSISAFANIIKGSIDSAAALNDLAIQTGATVEELSGLASVGKFSEQTAQSIGAAMNKLSKNMAGASEESRGTGAALKALGINFESFAKLSPAQQMQDVAGKMAQFADGGGKAAVVMGLYGKSGAALLPMFKDLAVAGELQAKITTEQAAAADDFSDDLIRLRARGEAWKKDLSFALLPALNDFLGTLLKSGGIMQTFSGWVKDLAKSGQLTAWAQAAREGIELLMAAIKPAALILGSWFALFVAAPAIYAAAVAALTPLVHGLALYITNILIGQAATMTWNTALFGTSVAAQLAAGSLSKIGLAASILFAAFAGWQIGTYLREQFVEARVAGLAFVAVMLIGWENVKYAGQLAWEGIKFSFGAAIAIMQGVFAGFLSATAKGLDFIGAGDAAAKMAAYAESLRVSAGAQKTFAEQTAGLTAAHKKEVAAIDDTIADMVRFELATDAASKAAKKLAAVPKPKLPDILIPDGRDKPAAQASEYDKIIKAIAEKTAVENLALASAAKLTDGDKYQAKILEDLRLGYLKITPAQQAHIKVQLAAYLQAEQLNAQKAAYIKRIQAEYAEQEQTRAEQGAAQVAIDNARAASRAVVDDYVRAIKEQNEVTDIEIALDKKSSAERSLALGQHRIELELKKQLAAIDASSGFDASDKAENAARVRAAAAAATASLKAQTVLAAAKELDSFLDASRAENFGQALAGAFGKAGKAIADMSGIFSKYAKQQEGFEVARSAAGVAYANDSKQLSAAQEAISKQELASKLGAFGDMANAAKGFFMENSAGYKTMEGVAKVAHTAQLAINLIEMGQLAVKAVLNQAGGDPYTAIPRMAAMAIAVGALGFAVGGGFNKSSGDQASAADRQKTQGTGTVLGDADAKSKALADSLKFVETNTSEQLRYSAGMLTSLRGIERAMGGLASLVYRTAGIASGNSTGIKQGVLSTLTFSDYLGGGALGTIGKVLEGISSSLPLIGGLLGSIHNAFGRTTQTIKDSGLLFSGSLAGLRNGQGASSYADVEVKETSFFGLRSDTNNRRVGGTLEADFRAQIGKVFGGIGDTLTGIAKSFGFDVDAFNKLLGDQEINFSVSLRGLKGQELEDALSSTFGAAADRLAADLIPGLAGVQKAGESYFQALVRVSTELQTANTWLKAFGNNLFAASVAGGVAADGLVQLFGGLEDFNKSNQNYFKEYYSDAERNAIQTGLLSGELKKLGLAMPTSRDGLRAMIDEASKHLDTESGREFYAQLRAMAPAFAELVPSAEKLIGVLAGLKDTQNDLQVKLLEAQGNAAGAAALKKALDLVRLGVSIHARQ